MQLNQSHKTQPLLATQPVQTQPLQSTVPQTAYVTQSARPVFKTDSKHVIDFLWKWLVSEILYSRDSPPGVLSG